LPDSQPRDLQERGDDLLGHPVAEVPLLGIRAEVLEREHD